MGSFTMKMTTPNSYSLHDMTQGAKLRLAKSLTTAYAATVAFLSSDLIAFASSLQSDVESITTNVVNQLSGPLFSLGLLMFFIGFAGWIFTTDKKKAVFQSIWIFGIVAVILFASNGKVINNILTTIKQIAGAS